MTDTDQIEMLANQLEESAYSDRKIFGGPWLKINANFLRSLSTTIKDLREKEKLYYELILEVSKKFPNETRHETALRYIRRAETNENSPTKEG